LPHPVYRLFISAIYCECRRLQTVNQFTILPYFFLFFVALRFIFGSFSRYFFVLGFTRQIEFNLTLFGIWTCNTNAVIQFTHILINRMVDASRLAVYPRTAHDWLDITATTNMSISHLVINFAVSLRVFFTLIREPSAKRLITRLRQIYYESLGQLSTSHL